MKPQNFPARRMMRIACSSLFAFMLSTQALPWRASPALAEPLQEAVTLGSTGIGAQVAMPISRDDDIRLTGSEIGIARPVQTNYQLLNVSLNLAVDEHLKLGSFSLLYDHHPHGGMFFYSAGAVLNMNDLFGRTRFADSSLVFDGNTYSAAQLDELDIDIRWTAIAPYIGVGWGGPREGRHRTTQIELGVYDAGNPHISYGRTGVIAANPAIFNPYLDTLSGQLRSQYSGFDIYPVLRVNIPIGRDRP